MTVLNRLVVEYYIKYIILHSSSFLLVSTQGNAAKKDIRPFKHLYIDSNEN